MFVIACVAGGLTLVGGMIALGIHFDRKRTSELEAVASQMGLMFEKYADEQTATMRSRFDLFSKGHGRKSWNAIFGETNGTGIWMFDYQYTTGGGKNSTTHYQTVICFGSSSMDLPRFSLYREGFMSRIGSGVFGMQDIDFETHPDFSKKFVLKGDSEDHIRATFQADLLSFLETQDKNLHVEADGDLLLMYRPRKKVKPDVITDFLTEGFGVFREFQPTG